MPNKSTPAFKTTELGPLPKEWEVVRLGEVVETSFSGGTPSTKKAEYWNGDIPWITSAIIADEDVFLSKYQRTITSAGLEHSASKVAPKGSLLVGTRVGVGKAVVPKFDVAVSQDLTALILNSKVEAVFLAYLFKSCTLQKQIQDRTRGTTIKGIPRRDLLQILIPLPPLPEQRRIAYVLRTIQQAKEATERVIAALKELKKSLMCHLFTYGPVPPAQAEQVPLKETEIGPVPEHWEVVRLGEVVKNSFSGGTPSTKKPEFWDGDIPWITSAMISEDDVFISRYQRMITKLGLEKSASKIAPKGSLVIGTRVGVGKAAVPTFDIAMSQDLTALILAPDIDPLFLAYLFKSPELQQQVKDRTRGTTIKGIPRRDLLNIPIRFPPLHEQREIARILQTVDRRIEAEEQRKSALEALFKTMLHLLMTGQIRLKYAFVQR